ncbi:hypothetical protein CYMTET_3755 [Cymbomonas tetramitiformis]|uniref:J domain-containing protein n=1 Tax=Cymbomonas tetramitiformis TaxID=36881 RepID=A0AAE0LKQ8_9CHLO|nr:hypothetical protein CYMTET_3755 [Cymbomonas tetramitiformis]|eukprot:gene24250-29450_t
MNLLPNPIEKATIEDVLAFVEKLCEVHGGSSRIEARKFLDLSPKHTKAERAQRRRAMARLLHPDRHARHQLNAETNAKLTRGMQIVNEVLSDAPDPRLPVGTKKPREANFFYDSNMYEDSDDDSRDDPHFLYCSESEVSDSEEEAAVESTEPPDRYVDPRGRRVSERVRARVMGTRAEQRD